jgi:putative transposase
MAASDVTETLAAALAASDCNQARVLHRPRLLSDNGPGDVAANLAKWLDEKRAQHIRRALCHQRIQGKIERWQQTFENGSCWRATTYPAASTCRSRLSASTTTTSATTTA